MEEDWRLQGLDRDCVPSRREPAKQPSAGWTLIVAVLLLGYSFTSSANADHLVAIARVAAGVLVFFALVFYFEQTRI